MKINMQRMAFALILSALMSAVSLANVKSKSVTFSEDVKVGGTLVKKGDYQVRFDDQTKEFTILKGKKVIAKTTASLEEQPQGTVNRVLYRSRPDKEGAPILLSVNMGGKEAVIGSDQTGGVVTAK